MSKLLEGCESWARFWVCCGPMRRNSFKAVVLVGDTLYTGAASGVDPATGAPPPDAQDEARIAMEGVKERLALADDHGRFGGGAGILPGSFPSC